jgi:O-antigen/teichoic acid export membrane protein
LIPRFLLWGAVASTGIAFTVMFAAGLWQAQRVRPFDFEYRRMALPLLAAVPVAILHFWLPPQGMLLQVLTGCCLMVIYVVLLLATGFLNTGEKRQAARTAVLLDSWLRGRLGLAVRPDS